jgi:hypothetical protein
MASRSSDLFLVGTLLPGKMEALRASAVPHPGKNILQLEVQIVNPYSGKGMTIWTSRSASMLPG